MKKILSWTSLLAFALLFKASGALQAQTVLFSETFPNSANTGFGVGPGSFTFTGDLGTWTVVAGDATGGTRATGAVTGPPSYSAPNSIVLANYTNSTASTSFVQFSSPVLNLAPYAGNPNINLTFRVNTTALNPANTCLTYLVEVYNGSTFTTLLSKTAQQMKNDYPNPFTLVALNIPNSALTSGFRVFISGFNASGCNVSDQFLYIDDLQIVNGAVILPVSFTSFAVNYNNSVAKLEWNVTESDVVSYTVERSADGRNFQTIGTVQANNGGHYSFADNLPSFTASNAYYRLLVKEASGRNSYSRIISARISRGFQGLTLTPNPAKSFTNLWLYSAANSATTVELYDFLGALKMKSKVTLSKGTNSIQLNLDESLPSGLYFIKVPVDGTIQTGKLLIQ